MEEFLAFRKFVTPVIIQVIFWLATVVVVIGALGMMFRGGFYIIMGLIWLVLGPLMVRIYCELLILFFRIYEELVSIRTGAAPGSGFPVSPLPPQ